MKITELLTEARMDPGIEKAMTQKGYKLLGAGQDQDAYLAPDGTILKIFGYDTDRRGFSRGQQSFIDFANFCMKNPNNQFLPQFGGWSKFTFNDQNYLQIKCERMFELPGYIGEILEDFVERVDALGAKEGVDRFIHWEVDRSSYPEDAAKIITMIGGKKELMLLAQTIEQLSKLADRRGYGLDLHSGNFMFGSDGEIVINDPFFTGTMRR